MTSTKAFYPKFVSKNSFIIIVTVPSPMRMSCIPNIDLSMSKTCLSEYGSVWCIPKELPSQSFPVASISNGNVNNSTWIHVIVIDPCRALIGMYMTRNKDVYTCLIQHFFHCLLHSISVMLMSIICVVPRSMQNHNEPWRPAPVHLFKIRLLLPSKVSLSHKVQQIHQMNPNMAGSSRRIINLQQIPECHDWNCQCAPG